MENKKIISIGEALIDFIPNKTGCDFNEITAFSPKIGGAPANVCGAVSKLGGTSQLITQLGNDLFGAKIKAELEEYNIDTSAIGFTNSANTALAFVSLDNDGNRRFSFYRNPSADMLLEAEDIKPEWFENAYALHFCSVSLGDFPMKNAHIKAIELAKANNMLVSFDPNLRFSLWNDKALLKNRVNEFIPLCDILKISDEELEFITGEKNIENVLDNFFNMGVKLVVYTCGKNGAYASTNGTKAYSPSISVKAVDTTGAGDGFIGSFLWKLQNDGVNLQNIDRLTSQQLENYLSFSNKFCSISVTSQGAISSYPTLSQMCE